MSSTNDYQISQIQPALLNARDFLSDRLSEGQSPESRSAAQAFQALSPYVQREGHEVDNASDAIDTQDLMSAIKLAHDALNCYWATTTSAVGRQALGAMNDLRTVMCFIQHGLEAAGGTLPKRHAPGHEIRQMQDDKLILALNTRWHAAEVLDAMDQASHEQFKDQGQGQGWGRYYLLDTYRGQKRLSFGMTSHLKARGITPEQFWVTTTTPAQARLYSIREQDCERQECNQEHSAENQSARMRG